MTHGSAFHVAGAALVDQLAARAGMAGWHVRYDQPRDDRDLRAPDGGRRAVWVDPEGDSAWEMAHLPAGWAEECTITLVFEVVDPMSAASQATVDEVAALGVGELIDLVTTDRRLSGAVLPEGWAVAWVQPAATQREGGPVSDTGGFGRRIQVQVTARMDRC